MLEQEMIQQLLSTGEFDKAIALCREEIERCPGDSSNYLILGQVYIAAGRKKEAIRVLSDGLLFENNQKIRNELNRLGRRGFRVISQLPREHPFNRILGKLLTSLRLR